MNGIRHLLTLLVLLGLTALSNESFSAVPEISLTGNGLTITNGDMIPGVADQTDFGSTRTNGGVVMRTLVIANTGDAPLNLTGVPRVQIGGANAADFTVVQQPPAIVFPNSSILLQITFDPSASGLRTATATITNNDADESAFSFAIQGTGSSVGEADAGFLSSASGRVECAAVQPDGKIIIAGSFTNAAGVARRRIARLNADGTSDSSFIGANIGASSGTAANSVRSIAVQWDGKIVVGGQFLFPANRMVRLNPDGTLATFNPNSDNNVNCVTLQPDGKILVGGAFTTIGGATHNHVARLNDDGTADSGFIGDVDGEVLTTALQPDEKVIIGGTFSVVSSLFHTNIARLNPNGTIDAAFTPNANGAVNTALVQPDGKIVIGGTFTNIGVIPRNRIARLNANGSLDMTFDPNLNSQVFSMALQADGRIIVAGDFNLVGGVTRKNIARLNADGTLDTSFNPNANNSVYCVTLSPDGSVIAGGDFSNIGNAARTRIARLVNDGVTESLTATGGDHIEWTRSGAAPELSEVAFETSADDGATWTAPVLAAPISGGWVATGLSLPSAGYIRARARTTGSEHDGSSGLFETVVNFPSGPDISVEQPLLKAIRDDGTRDFGHVAVGAETNLTFVIRNSGHSNLTGLTIVIDGPDAGMFTVASVATGPVIPGGATQFTIRFSPTSNAAKSAALHLLSNDPDEGAFDILLTGTGPGPEMGIRAGNGTIEDGSTTTSITNHTEFGSALVSGGTVVRTFTIENTGELPLNLTGSPAVQVSGVNASDFSITSPLTTQVPTGSNTTFQVTFDPSATGLRTATISIASEEANENPYNFVIEGTGALPGEVDTGFDPRPDRAITTATMQPDGKIVVGGGFINMGGVSRNYLARLNADGTLESAFNPNPSSTVYSIGIKADGQIMIGGGFTTVSGLSRTRLTRLNANGALDLGFNPTITVNNGPVGMVVLPNGSFVFVGAFADVSGMTRYGIAQISGNGIVDSFNPAPNFLATVQSVARQTNGMFIFGGSFSTIGGASRNSIARVDSNGAVDGGFNPNADGVVHCIAIQADGKIVIGGDFTTVGGTNRNHLARLNPDGTVDESFNPDVNYSIYTLALQTDGKSLWAGTSLQSAV